MYYVALEVPFLSSCTIDTKNCNNKEGNTHKTQALRNEETKFIEY